MEEREGTSNNILTSFGLKQHVAPPPHPPSTGVYQMDPPRSENPNFFPVGLLPNTTAASASVSAVAVKATENAAAAAPPFSLTMPVENSSSELAKKKRGRPRKYNPDGSLAVTLSPMPISSSVPLATGQRGRGRGRGRGGRGRGGRVEQQPYNNNNWAKHPRMFEFDNSSPTVVGTGEVVTSASFTPHVLTVNAGEDVTMKIMTFSQQEGSLAICVLSANGPISNVTLRQSTTSGGTLTYEGHFEILSLTGSFIPSESGGTRSRAGGMSVSLAGPDGRVFGGGLAGLFIAAGPVQVMVGTFVAGGQKEESQQQQIKKQRRERLGIPITTQGSNISFGGGSAEDPKARYNGVPNKPVVVQPPPVSAPPPMSFQHEPSTTNAVQGYYRNNTAADHIRDLFSSLPGEDDDEEDDENLEGEDDGEFGGHTESDNEVPS
ncbi:AT-hook motif nuclear-localized protein 4 [Raphanus sativus]|uniref:AT-hook motif nuclear-localized protein n=1 Tax=Raphanus sativus TaxID=3726 RepID=A0A6J0MJJ1_RAPSA|nr:AT-hook motif nuclear-localized protein 4 [Raphanus sativus]XP_018472656.1 AT-hook motif nuclear-localized protein 4 [Raphanus sativus]XP_018472657.1 AT-hook motif nuclear-localized protein 4 [Raphanus sativus]